MNRQGASLNKGRPTRSEYDYSAIPRRAFAPHSQDDYRDLNWYLARLDEVCQVGLATDKLPAVVSAYRTMMEAVGLIGPQTSINDNRVQVLALPDGLTTEQLIAIATGESMPSSAEMAALLQAPSILIEHSLDEAKDSVMTSDGEQGTGC